MEGPHWGGEPFITFKSCTCYLTLQSGNPDRSIRPGLPSGERLVRRTAKLIYFSVTLHTPLCFSLSLP